MATMPPKSPIGSSGVQVRPSSSETAMRIGYRPENRISRLPPARSTTRWIVGVSFEVAQFSGVGRRSDQVRPPSVLRFMTIGAPAVPLGIDGDDRLAVFEQDGGRVAEVLARLAIHDHLPMLLVGQVDQRDGVSTPRGLGIGRRRRARGRENEDDSENKCVADDAMARNALGHCDDLLDARSMETQISPTVQNGTSPESAGFTVRLRISFSRSSA